MLSQYPPGCSQHVLERVVAAVVGIEGMGHQEGGPVVPQRRMQPELGNDDDILLKLLGGKWKVQGLSASGLDHSACLVVHSMRRWPPRQCVRFTHTGTGTWATASARSQLRAAHMEHLVQATRHQQSPPFAHTRGATVALRLPPRLRVLTSYGSMHEPLSPMFRHNGWEDW